MQLDVKKRETVKKKDPKRLRREGSIPAILYGLGKVGKGNEDKGNSAQPLSIDAAAFQAHLRKIPSGRLSTVVFDLKGEGVHTKAIVKDIQYHVVSYDVLHLDFQALEKGKTISVNVPVVLTGVVDCVGVKQGGQLNQPLRYISLKCPATEIPEIFSIDVKDLMPDQVVKVEDLKVADNVQVLTPAGDVVVIVTKK